MGQIRLVDHDRGKHTCNVFIISSEHTKLDLHVIANLLRKVNFVLV